MGNKFSSPLKNSGMQELIKQTFTESPDDDYEFNPTVRSVTLPNESSIGGNTTLSFKVNPMHVLLKRQAKHTSDPNSKNRLGSYDNFIYMPGMTCDLGILRTITGTVAQMKVACIKDPQAIGFTTEGNLFCNFLSVDHATAGKKGLHSRSDTLKGVYMQYSDSHFSYFPAKGEMTGKGAQITASTIKGNLDKNVNDSKFQMNDLTNCTGSSYLQCINQIRTLRGSRWRTVWRIT